VREGSSAVCGDGYLDEGEVCDDGVNDGAYGGCATDCLSRAAHCGDGILNGIEACDDGVNHGAYGSCTYDCSSSMGYCGDGLLSGPELCDDGANDNSYDGCDTDCLALGPRCGDGLANGPEFCDDGINDGSCGSCTADCSDYGSGTFLTELRVTSIPDAWGYPVDFWPDMFLEVTDTAGLEVWVSDPRTDTNPPVTFDVPEIPVEDELLYVHVWDDDGGAFLGADDLGEVTIDTSQRSGTVTAGDLTVRFTVEELSCP
jgi:cysteine-rich repeat protein